MPDSITVYNTAPHPLGYAIGRTPVLLKLGANQVDPDGFVSAYQKPGAIHNAVGYGQLRMDKYDPLQVSRVLEPRKARISVDAEKPGEPSEIQLLHTTTAVCPKMAEFLKERLAPAKTNAPRKPVPVESETVSDVSGLSKNNLRALLQENGIEHDGRAGKAALLALAKEHGLS